MELIEGINIEEIVDNMIPQLYKNGNISYVTLEIKRIALRQYLRENFTLKRQNIELRKAINDMLGFDLQLHLLMEQLEAK